MAIDALYDLFLHDLKSIYYIETRLLGQLEMMIGEATDEDLIEALQRHHEETAKHVERVENIFSIIEEEAEEHEYGPFKGLIDEAEHLNQDIEEVDIVNIAFLNAGIQVERIEMSLYEGLLLLSRRMEMDGQIPDLLEQNLADEEDALKSLKALKTESTLERLIERLLP